MPAGRLPLERPVWEGLVSGKARVGTGDSPVRQAKARPALAVDGIQIERNKLKKLLGQKSAEAKPPPPSSPESQPRHDKS